MLNYLLFLLPSLFGCHRVILTDVETKGDIEKLFRVLRQMDAVRIAESHTPCDELSNYCFKLNGQWIGLAIEEYKPVKIIAPNFVIEKIRAGLAAG